jgi:sulfate-transporting ATPase
MGILMLDNQVYYYTGSYTEYEADRRKRLGNKEPTRLKYAALA